MEDKQFVLTDNKTISIGLDTVDRLINSADGNAALLYLYILRNEGTISLSSFLSDLKLSAEQLDSAVDVLSKLGLVSDSLRAGFQPAENGGAASPQTPQYTQADIAREIDDSSPFRHLVGETQRRLGKPLSSSELTILLGLKDFLGLPVEVISLLVTHCTEQALERYGPGRMPSMRQIEKEGYIWSERGVDTVELATEHLKKLNEFKSKLGEIKQALQISGRALTASEENYINSWLEMGFNLPEIELAYEKTVLNTGSLKWQYMNSIVKKWNKNGFHNIDEIMSHEKCRSSKSSHDMHEANAIELMKNYRNSQKEL